MSTALIKRGTLKNGSILTAGLAWCKVRRMLDEKQCTLHQAPPSTPVEIVGWRTLPMPGDIIIEVPTEVIEKIYFILSNETVLIIEKILFM